MTDAERQKILSEAVAHLKLTTVGYYGRSDAWKKNTSTQWWQGLSRIETVIRDLDPVVPPVPPVSGRTNLAVHATTLDGMMTWLAAHPGPAYVPAGVYPTTAVVVIPPGCDLELRDVTVDTRNANASSLRIHGAGTRLAFKGVCRIGKVGQRYARQMTAEQAGLNIKASNLTVHADDLTIEGIADIGVLVWGASKNVTVTGKITCVGTGADSFHTTGGSTDVDWQADLTAIDSGDDGAAVVSYGTEPVCQRVRYRHVTVKGNQVTGRGVSCVGGKDCAVDWADISDTAGAGVYAACEPEYSTLEVDGWTVTAKVRRPNRKGVHPANVVVYSGVPGKAVRNVTVKCDPDPAFPLVQQTGPGVFVNVSVTSV